jgi:hypothetical protein
VKPTVPFGSEGVVIGGMVSTSMVMVGSNWMATVAACPAVSVVGLLSPCKIVALNASRPDTVKTLSGPTGTSRPNSMTCPLKGGGLAGSCIVIVIGDGMPGPVTATVRVDKSAVAAQALVTVGSQD